MTAIAIRSSISAAVLALALGFSACGGSNDDEQVAADAVTEAWTSPDPAICTELTTEAFLGDFHGDEGEEGLQRCTRATKGGTAGSAEVSNVELNGERATVEVAIMGGGSQADGQTLKHALVKENDQWKRDGPVSFVRFDREAYLAAAELSSLKGSDRYSRVQRECVLGALADFSDAELQTFALLQIRALPPNALLALARCRTSSDQI